MSRVKTFDATGVAPNGRLYSGDLNLIQDQYSDLVNFSQTHDVGTLRVGDSTLQLVKFGTGEFRLTGDVRTDGLIRGLGGLYAGAFTTAARDALVQADRPAGLIILNTTKNRLEWNSGSDVTPAWRGLALGIESIDTPANFLSGSSNLAGRPAANTVATGSFWYVTDMDTVFRSNGTTWDRIIPVKPGKVEWYARSSAPAGSLVCDGTALPAATTIYADLRAELIAEGNPYGVSGSDPRIPNAGGRTIVGLSSDTEFDAMGEAGGAKTHTLTGPESGIAVHGHTVDSHTHDMTHDHALQERTNWSFAVNSNGIPLSADAGTIFDAGGGGASSPVKTLFGSTGGAAPGTNNAGPSNAASAHNNLQPYVTLRPIIHL